MALKRHAPEAPYDSLYEDGDRGHSGSHHPPYADHSGHSLYDPFAGQAPDGVTRPGYPGQAGHAETMTFPAHPEAVGHPGGEPDSRLRQHAYAEGHPDGPVHAGRYDGGFEDAFDGGFDGGFDGTRGYDDHGTRNLATFPGDGHEHTRELPHLQEHPHDVPGAPEASAAPDSVRATSPGPDSSTAPGEPVPEHASIATAFGPEPELDENWSEWNPTEDSLRPVRGRHRVAKQRGGMARSSAVLGVGMIAAVGAGGIASAKDKSPTAISVPDLASAAGNVTKDLPLVGGLVGDEGGSDAESGSGSAAEAPLSGVTLASAEGPGKPDAGESLRSRILAQAAQQQAEADREDREEAASAAAQKAAAEAAKKTEAAKKAEEERKRKAAAEAARKAEEERLAKLARSYTLPVSSYTLTSGYGAGGSMWENDHTGQDFAAQTGTPVKAVHSGTVTEAGWAGSYGYRIVLKLDDGTEIWYCHLSSMQVSAGSEVNTKDVIGNVGSTGNSTGPHLHLEVRPGGGDPVDPLSWLRGKGLNV